MDLTCHSKFDGAFFHQIYNCLLPVVAHMYAAHAMRGTVCVSPFMRRWYHALAPNATLVETCAHPAPTIVPASPRAILERLLQPYDAPAQHIVLVLRNKTRTFMHFERLRDALTTLGRVVVYKGTESAAATIALFRNARAIVGYHGAAFSNAVFARNATTVELTTYAALNSSRMWRSNGESLRPWLSRPFVVLPIPLSRLLAANGVALRVKDSDHFIKNLRRVPLEVDTIERVVSALVRSL